MSFSETTSQIRNRTKTVTRRAGWGFLKPGDTVMACVKTMGLKKGEKVEKICPIRIVSVSQERIGDIANYGHDELVKEGFGGRVTKEKFIALLMRLTGGDANTPINRIEFEYIGGSSNDNN
jgi:hypothetical protein